MMSTILSGSPSGNVNPAPQPGSTVTNHQLLLLKVLAMFSRHRWGRLFKISVRLVGSSQVAVAPVTFPENQRFLSSFLTITQNTKN